MNPILNMSKAIIENLNITNEIAIIGIVLVCMITFFGSLLGIGVMGFKILEKIIDK